MACTPSFFAHLYRASLNALATWYLQRTPSTMCEIHHHDEFWPVDFLEWLITCNDPLRKKLFELLLVPRSLLKALLDASN